MENTLVQEGYKNYRKGDPISDEQLKALIKNHKQILSGLDEINDRRFDLFRNQVNSDLINFEGFKKARERKH